MLVLTLSPPGEPRNEAMCVHCVIIYQERLSLAHLPKENNLADTWSEVYVIMHFSVIIFPGVIKVTHTHTHQYHTVW